MSIVKKNSPAKEKSPQNHYITFTFLSLFVFGLIDNSRGPIYPKVIDVFGLLKSQSSWIFTLTSLVSFFMALTSFKWIGKFGAIKSMKIALGLHAISLIIMGSSSFNKELFWLFLIGSVFLGLAMGTQTVTVNLVISKVSTPDNSSRLFSGLHSMYGAASLLAPLVFGAIFHFDLSWQISLFAMALAPLAMWFKFRNLAPLNLSGPAAMRTATGRKETIKLGIIFSFYVACEILLSTRMVIYLFESDLSLDRSSYLLTAFFILLLGGRALFSFYRPPFKTITMLKLSLMGTLAIFIVSLLFEPWPLFLCGLTMSYFFPFGMDQIKKTYDDSEPIIAKVMMFVGAMIAGMHFVFGAISELAGIEAAMWIGPFMLGVSLMLLYRLKS